MAENIHNVKSMIEVLKASIEIFEKSGEKVIKELKPRDSYEIYDMFESAFEQHLDNDEDYVRFDIPMPNGLTEMITFVSYGEEGFGTGPIYRLDWNYWDVSLDDLCKKLSDLEAMLIKPTIINLTLHDINIYDNEGMMIAKYESQGQARVDTREVKIYDIDGIDVKRTEYLDVVGLPEPQPNTYYIVSLLVLQALEGKRADLIAPNTSPKSVVRDAEGKISGVTSFTTIA